MRCALALSCGWIFSINWYFIGGKDGISWGYAVIDAALAAYFWRLSARKIFPTILFFLHASLVCYHLYISLVGTTGWWIAAFLNRIVEAALLYVIFGSVYRMRARAGRSEEARRRRASIDVDALRPA